ncbi:2-dehydropantoate 2-reductase [Phenylobacterium deserti]|uniref:2-dehydropantoate 2-reductase n=1 Tax=Phenylobacterium deserti TaxID=1914756 RepID=A0A328ANR9_9CAUL|nr:2-dehydropantoate 2-reductase [Phenylobacterium deserti]RAK56653.1 2-dehydropantoate 2-reductase [Phenylobacterium deserti]
MAAVAVIGPGAIGGTLAAWLMQSGHQVTLCVRTPLDRLEIDTPRGPLSATPVILTDPAVATAVDWVLATTKTYDVAAAANWLGGLVGPATRVAVIQNGVEHLERFAPYLAADKLLPVIIDLPAERLAPGRIHQRRDGTMLVPEGAAGADFAALFAGTPIVTSTTDEFTTAAWRKLCLNCAGAVSALVLQPGGVARRDDVAELMRGLVAECVAVGRAEGAQLSLDLPDAIVEGYRTAPADSVNSMHADRLAGRPMEIDARNGVIVRRGARHGIPTPLNQLMVTLLEAAQG